MRSSSPRHKAKCENRHFTPLPCSSSSAQLCPILTLPSARSSSRPRAGRALLRAEPSIRSHPPGCRPCPAAAPGTRAGGDAPQIIRSTHRSRASSRPGPLLGRPGKMLDSPHCSGNLALPGPTGFNGAIRIVLVDKSRFVSPSHDSKPRLHSIYKSKSPSCKCQAQISAPKAKPGECFQPEREWKSCICKS